MFFGREFFSNRILQACLAVLVFVYFLAFHTWTGRSLVTSDRLVDLGYRCPRFFQNCESLYFLRALPDGYSQTLFYMLMLGLLAWIVYLLTERRWVEAARLLIIPYLWHAAHIFFLTDSAHGNYEYYILIFATIVLFLPHKEYFAKLAVVMFYVLSTIAKMHPAWIAGAYFTNMQLGLPLFPDWSIPLWTNLVILMELIGAWFLLSKHPWLQKTVFGFFVLFHLYSGILVEYRYPATVMPMLLVLFGPWYRWTPPPLTRRSLWGWGLAALLIFMQLTPKMIPGDEKLTLEGNFYGLFMFESNHQCISQATYHYQDGSSIERIHVSGNARNRCDPYRYWFTFNQFCDAHPETVERVSWTFDHSINGDPFIRIVDVEDICSLEYHPFTHNEWIKTHADDPEVIGNPVKNIYH